MKIERIYFERLVSHGNYENTRIGMEAAVYCDASQNSEAVALLKQEVDTALAATIGADQAEQETQYVTAKLATAQRELEETREAMRCMKKWIEEHRPLVDLFCNATGRPMIDFNCVPF